MEIYWPKIQNLMILEIFGIGTDDVLTLKIKEQSISNMLEQGDIEEVDRQLYTEFYLIVNHLLP